jgi:FdhD protein
MKSPAHRELHIDALRDAGNVRRADAIAVEEPLEIRLMRDGLPEADDNGGTGRSISITMRTPGNDAELAVGFLFGEGLLRDARDVVDVGFCGLHGQCHSCEGTPDLPLDLARLARNFYTTSSCGVCGKASIDAVTANAGDRRIEGGLVVREVRPAPPAGAAPQVQAGFAETGGMHAVGLFTAGGELIASREDVGRHNAIGQTGRRRVARWPVAVERPRDPAVRAREFRAVAEGDDGGAPVVAAIGAPSTLAVELAESAGITLVAFLRDAGCNVYSHPGRVYSSRGQS